jgi:hypothetical protein
MRKKAFVSWHRRAAVALLATCGLTAIPEIAAADEGGLSFWLPGLFGSLAAAPGQPGLSWSTTYYHTSLAASGGQTFQLGGSRGASIVAGLHAQGDLAFFGPTYIFATPVLGGQLSLGIFGLGGRNVGSISATLTGPLGRSISGALTQGLSSVGDVIPQAALKWNAGVNNYMVYTTGDIPVGDYNPSRIVNLGLGHGAIDAGGGYTYFDPKAGNEFSATLGFTYNLENVDTNYQNGVDMHLDLGASHFFTKQLQLGAVGYAYQQISCDSGSGDRLGCFESRVFGAGPQIGYIVPMGSFEGYFNFKIYKEFAAENRPSGWNSWLTFAISPAPAAAAPPAPIAAKY